MSCPYWRASSYTEGTCCYPHGGESGSQWSLGMGTSSAMKISAPRQDGEDTSGEQTYVHKKISLVLSVFKEKCMNILESPLTLEVTMKTMSSRPVPSLSRAGWGWPGKVGGLRGGGWGGWHSASRKDGREKKKNKGIMKRSNSKNSSLNKKYHVKN